MNSDIDSQKTPTKRNSTNCDTPTKRKNASCETPSKKKKINKTKVAEDYFVFKEDREVNGVMKRFYNCIICNKEINGTKDSNKWAHLLIHDEVNSKLHNLDESIERKRLKLILDCVEMVAVNGRSFSHLYDSALHSMISETLSELKSAGRQVNLNDSNLLEVKESLRRMSENAKKKIADEIKDRPLSLMCDIATKHGRSIFGFSLQYIVNGKHRIRSIGMIHLTSSHTGKYLAAVIANRLADFGVQKDQLMTVTTDNGANMIKMIKNIQEITYTVDRSKNTTNTLNTA